MMAWAVFFHDEFVPEFDRLPTDVKKELLATARLLEARGPTLGRPYVDTLKGSTYSNLKELRIAVADGQWRVAFAFDPERAALLLVAANKTGVNQQRFYKNLLRVAESRYAHHLSRKGGP